MSASTLSVIVHVFSVCALFLSRLCRVERVELCSHINDREPTSVCHSCVCVCVCKVSIKKQPSKRWLSPFILTSPALDNW